MQIITLTTDWKINDFYSGVVKGQLYSRCAGATIVDLAHEISPFNLRQAAFIVRNTYLHFPPGTIHIVSVLSSGVSPSSGPLLVAHKGHYLLLPDTGILGMIFPDEPEKVYRIEQKGKTTTFPVIDSFLKVAEELVQGKTPDELGKATDEYHRTIPVRATFEDSVITGSIIHVDSYSNAITNIQRSLFQRIGKKRKFILYPGSNHYQITRISENYGEVEPGDIFALFNSLDLLEIGIYQGNAAELLGLTINSTVRINFKEK